MYIYLYVYRHNFEDGVASFQFFQLKKLEKKPKKKTMQLSSTTFIIFCCRLFLLSQHSVPGWSHPVYGLKYHLCIDDFQIYIFDLNLTFEF